MSQVTVRMTSEIRAFFEKYANEVGLDASELARLLILRAMRRRKLLRSVKQNNLKGVKGRGHLSHRKLTAHFHHAESVEEFDDFASASGLNRAAAAKLIFERELDERWLAHALLWAPRKPKIAR